MSIATIGFIGAGGIARAHAYALQALKFYYDSCPDIVFESVPRCIRSAVIPSPGNMDSGGQNRLQNLL